VLGQRIQPLALSASQNEGERIFKDRTGTRRNSFQPIFLIANGADLAAKGTGQPLQFRSSNSKCR
jgi:hypothetical protein